MYIFSSEQNLFIHNQRHFANVCMDSQTFSSSFCSHSIFRLFVIIQKHLKFQTKNWLFNSVLILSHSLIHSDLSITCLKKQMQINAKNFCVRNRAKSRKVSGKTATKGVIGEFFERARTNTTDQQH